MQFRVSKPVSWSVGQFFSHYCIPFNPTFFRKNKTGFQIYQFITILAENLRNEMNRTFHARITWNQVAVMIVAAVLAIWAFWIKQALLAVVFLLMLIVLIERIIHTTYTVTTDGMLVLYYGRFTKGREIILSDIRKAERFKGWLTHGVDIFYGANDHVAVQPVNEIEFLNFIQNSIIKK